MESAAFLRGLGAGAVAGAAVAVMMTAKRGAMRTGVGRAMQKAGAAMDNALFDMQRLTR